MQVTWQNYGRREVDRETMRYWFDKLKSYEFTDVDAAFDTWLKSQSNLPTINEILKLCKPKVTIFARLPSPLSIESNQRHAKEVKQAVEQMTKPRTNRYRAWIKPILTKPSDYPDIAVRLAKEASGAVVV